MRNIRLISLFLLFFSTGIASASLHLDLDVVNYSAPAVQFRMSFPNPNPTYQQLVNEIEIKRNGETITTLYYSDGVVDEDFALRRWSYDDTGFGSINQSYEYDIYCRFIDNTIQHEHFWVVPNMFGIVFRNDGSAKYVNQAFIIEHNHEEAEIIDAAGGQLPMLLSTADPAWASQIFASGTGSALFDKGSLVVQVNSVIKGAISTLSNGSMSAEVGDYMLFYLQRKDDNTYFCHNFNVIPAAEYVPINELGVSLSAEYDSGVKLSLSMKNPKIADVDMLTDIKIYCEDVLLQTLSSDDGVVNGVNREWTYTDTQHNDNRAYHYKVIVTYCDNSSSTTTMWVTPQMNGIIFQGDEAKLFTPDNQDNPIFYDINGELRPYSGQDLGLLLTTLKSTWKDELYDSNGQTIHDNYGLAVQCNATVAAMFTQFNLKADDYLLFCLERYNSQIYVCHNFYTISPADYVDISSLDLSVDISYDNGVLFDLTMPDPKVLLSKIEIYKEAECIETLYTADGSIDEGDMKWNYTDNISDDNRHDYQIITYYKDGTSSSQSFWVIPQFNGLIFKNDAVPYSDNKIVYRSLSSLSYEDAGGGQIFQILRSAKPDVVSILFDGVGKCRYTEYGLDVSANSYVQAAFASFAPQLNVQIGDHVVFKLKKLDEDLYSCQDFYKVVGQSSTITPSDLHGLNTSSLFDASDNAMMDVILELSENLASIYAKDKGGKSYSLLTISQGGFTMPVQFNPQQAGLHFSLENINTLIALSGHSVSSANHLNMYVTGTCSNASANDLVSLLTGQTGDVPYYNDAFLFLNGTKGQTLDLYMEDFRITGMQNKDWTMTWGIAMGTINADEMFGTGPTQRNNVMSLMHMDGKEISFTRGMAAPLAFSSFSTDEANPFQVNIHIRGNNHLAGGAQSGFTNESKSFLLDPPQRKNLLGVMKNLLGIEASILVNVFGEMTKSAAAPIIVRPDTLQSQEEQALYDFNETVCHIRFDDIWRTSSTSDATVRTNGRLELPIIDNSSKDAGFTYEYDRSAPSIDYGNKKGQVVFDGGRYMLTTAATPPNQFLYSASHAICYRVFDFNSAFSHAGSNISLDVAMEVVYPNSGASVGTGMGDLDDPSLNQNVIIFDGTFETQDYDLASYNDVVEAGWYNDYSDLRLPYNSRIYGGTFNNCEVFRCADATQIGGSPIYIPNGTTDTITLCRKEYDITTDENISLFGTVSPTIGTMSKTDGLPTSHTIPATGDEPAKNYDWTYNTASLTPNSNKLYLYQPGDCRVYETDLFTRNYVTLFAELGNSLFTLGGPDSVSVRYQDRIRQENGYLFHMTPNDASIEYTTINVMGMPLTMGDVMPDREKSTHSNVLKNPKEYDILWGIYMLRSFMSNQWYMFSPPFDVNEIYVIEIPAANDSFVGESMNDTSSDAYQQHIQQQAEKENDMYEVLVNSKIIPNSLAAGTYGPKMDPITLLTTRTAGKTGAIDVVPIIHYNPDLPGHNSQIAHYYLYHLKGRWGEWNKEVSLGNYSQNWEFVAPTDHEYVTDDERYRIQGGELVSETEPQILLEKGEIYSMMLPAGKDRYWDNKYIIFQGYGPQHLYGREEFEEYTISADENDKLYMQGNYVFANDTINTPETPIWIASRNGAAWEFEKIADNPKYPVYIGDVYMVTNGNPVLPNPANAPRLSSMQSEEEYGQLQPISNNVTLSAWTDNGIYVQSYSDQWLSIFTIDGRTLWQGQVSDGQQVFLPVSQGVYLVKGENGIIKLINK